MKVVLLWLINENQELLLAQRAAHRKTDASCWGPSVTGKLEADEDPAQAVLREAHEELGVSLDPTAPRFLGEVHYHTHSDGRPREFSMYYAPVSAALLDEFKLNEDEVAAVKWMPVDEFRQLQRSEAKEITNSHAHEMWDAIFNNLESINTVTVS